MMDKILGLSALAIFVAYLGVLVVKVPSPDLIGVLLVVIAFACFDFFRTLFREKPKA